MQSCWLVPTLKRHAPSPGRLPPALYRPAQVLAADPRVHETLSELLLPHLQRYATPGDALPPLDLDKCASMPQVRRESGRSASARAWGCMVTAAGPRTRRAGRGPSFAVSVKQHPVTL